MSKIELPPLPPMKRGGDYEGFVPPEDGAAASYWAEGFNECRDLISARDRQIVEVCAARCESLAQLMEQGAGEREPGARLRQAARAIRNLIEESNRGDTA